MNNFQKLLTLTGSEKNSKLIFQVANLIQKDKQLSASPKWLFGADHLVLIFSDESAYRLALREDYFDNDKRESAICYKLSRYVNIVLSSPIFVNNDPWPYYQIPMIEGQPLDNTRWIRMSHNSKLNTLSQLATMLKSLHNQLTYEFSHLFTTNSIEDFWSREFDRAKRYLYGFVTIKHFRWLESQYAQLFDLISKSTLSMVIVHGDLGPDHILMNATTNSLAGVIDFSDSMLFDPAYDFQLEYVVGRKYLRMLVNSYGQVDSLFWPRRNVYESLLPSRTVVFARISKNDKLLEKSLNWWGQLMKKL